MIVNLSPLTTSDLILAISALILLLYAFFTFKLWRQSIIQTDLTLMPIPIIYVRKFRGRGRIFRIRNLGYGPMLNIQIEEFNIILKKPKKIYTFKLTVPSPNVLEVKEERDLESETYINNTTMESLDLSAHLDPEFAKYFIPIEIKFEDIRGVKYTTTIGMGTGKLSVLKPVKKVGEMIDSTSLLQVEKGGD